MPFPIVTSFAGHYGVFKFTVTPCYVDCNRPGHSAKGAVMAIESSTLPPEPAVSPCLLTERDLCARIRLSPAHVQAMRRKGTGPRFVRIGKAVRYPDVAVSDWLAALSAQR